MECRSDGPTQGRTSNPKTPVAQGRTYLETHSRQQQEQALYVLLAATGMRVSEALAVETRHFINSGRTIVVEQQVEKNVARIVQYLKTDAAWREVDLHPDIAEYVRRYMTGK